MKRFVYLLLCCVILVGCGSSNDSSKEKQSKQEETDQKADEGERTLDDIESFLIDKKALIGEKTQMAPEVIGAVDGFKYKESNAEIYEYDTTTENYEKLCNGEEIPIEGMEGFTVKAVSVNGKFILMGEPSQEIIDTFNSFK